MTPERWQQVARVYQSAMEQEPDTRGAYLTSVCGDDNELRREVESLLAQPSAPGFIDRPLVDAAAHAFGGATNLAPGTMVGPYRIVGLIGEGGMGQVYRAQDTKLPREVALKILPGAFVHDPDRLARFRQEAHVLASLNHPNIATIHGFEESGSVHALVLELVDGPTLADRIARGPLAFEEALAIARHIADALEAAHERGIIHRDLKPANIKVRDDGTVKVLDFGLAKLTESTASAPAYSAPLSMSPTITSPAMMTGVGMLLGTAAYMSPEQARGRVVDKRADIWSFGCVLFEMLTEHAPFEGEDIAETIGAVIHKAPPWASLPATTSATVRTVLARCLEKDPKQRFRDIGDVQLALSGALHAPITDAIDAAATDRARHSARVWQAVAALLALMTVAGATAWWSASRSKAPSVTRFFVYPPEKTTFLSNGRAGTSVAISPDGTKLAFTARDTSGKVLLWTRSLDSLTAHPFPGTDNAAYPFWSPDSRFIAYFTPQHLLKIAASGGPPQPLCDTNNGTLSTAVSHGGSWSRDGTIVFNPGPGRALSRVSSAGGQPSESTRLARGQTEHAFPEFLPDGRHFLLYASATSVDVAGVYVGSLDTTDATRLAAADSAAVYDSQNGHLLFVRQGTLVAQRFDTSTLLLTGESFPIAERVEGGDPLGIAAFSTSGNGILAYGVSPETAVGLQMAWFDRQGKEVDAVGPPGNYRGIDLAPDGGRVAAHRHDGNGGDIWVTTLSGSATSRFTFDTSQENTSPIWSPDGTLIVYASRRNGKSGLYRRPANNAGTEERLVESDDATMTPMSWTPDGRLILYELVAPRTSNDLWVLPLSGDRKPFPLLDASFNESHGQISPDGKWLAYYSNETGRAEVYVQPFPSGAGKWQVSTNGGWFPRWRRDGRELFYMTQASGGKMMSVDVTSTGLTFEAGSPKELFDSPYVNLVHTGTAPGASQYHAFAVSPDGQRFLIPHPPSIDVAALAMPIVVVENWFTELQQRVPTR